MTVAPLAAGWALGVFHDPADPPGDVFTGLVAGDRVRDVSALGTVNELLANWDDAQRRLGELAAASHPPTAGFPVTGGNPPTAGHPGTDGNPVTAGGPPAGGDGGGASQGTNQGTSQGTWIPLDRLDVRCPVSPGQILQCGANYRKHVVDIVMAERRADLSSTGHNSQVPEAEVRQWAQDMMDERARTGDPYVFAGLPSALTGPYDDIVLPDRGTNHDWELELAAVIGAAPSGAPARHLTKGNALDHVAGYTICNDITTRSLVYRKDLKAIGTDWLAAKNAPTFLPTGPFLVPKQFTKDPVGLRITLKHNDVIRQDETTADMLFDLPAILTYITGITELRPGDLVLTGSPAGNGMHWGVFLAEGDLLEGEITGLGAQRNRCVRKRAPAAPKTAPQTAPR